MAGVEGTGKKGRTTVVIAGKRITLDAAKKPNAKAAERARPARDGARPTERRD